MPRIDANSSSVAVLLNNGDGTFAAPSRVDFHSRPTAIVAADFDARDGPDIATGSSVGSRPVTVSFNNGDGTFTTPFGSLFLLVTAFLLQTTMLRLVRMEREQIGLMKAFGVSRTTVAVHYVKLALVPVVAGAMVGSAVGVWLANALAGVYARFYQFPEVDFHLDPSVVWTALAIALVAVATLTAQDPEPRLVIVSPTTSTFASGPTELRAEVDAPDLFATMTFFVEGRQACVLDRPPYACTYDVGPQVSARQVRLVADLA